jgi:uncharacterized protein DUF4174
VTRNHSINNKSTQTQVKRLETRRVDRKRRCAHIKRLMPSPAVHLAALLVVLTGFLVPSAAAADVFSDARWRFRLVVVNAAAEDDPLRLAQRAEVDRDAGGWSERRIRLVEVVRNRVTCNGEPIIAPATQIRAALALPPKPGRVLLIGLDGEVKLRQSHAATNEQLFGLIDSMPMRRAERAEGAAPPSAREEDGC